MKKRWFIIAIVCAIGGYFLIRPTAKLPPAVRFAESIKNIDSDQRWSVEESDQKQAFIQALFSSPFFYLGRGKQCEVYASQDSHYVVKLLRQKPLSVKPKIAKIPDYFPFSLFKEHQLNERLERKQALLESFMIAYQKIPEYTGIVFLHLNPTKDLFKKVLFTDPLGNPCSIELDSAQFVVQKKAQLLKPVLIELMCKNDLEAAKSRIDQVFALLFDCAKKGVFDLDTGLIRRNNIGLLEDRAIYIDTGKLRYMPNKVSKERYVLDLKRLKPLYRWLLTYYPELAAYYEIREKQSIDAF